MKVLITGGAGFIGSHIAEKLQQMDAQIMILDNFSGGVLENIPAGVPHVKMDVRDPQLCEWMDQEKFDYIIHQAAQVSVPESLKSPQEDESVNISGLVNLLEAARKSGVKRIIFASTAAVYGDVEETDLPIPESLPQNPLSFYGLSKQTAEKYLHLYWINFGLEYVILRYANVYGERQGAGGEGGVIDIFCKKILADAPIQIFGDGGQTRDFIHAADVAAANAQALLTSRPNQVYNISTQTEISLNNLIDLLSSLSDHKIDVRHLPPRSGDILRSVLDSSSARTHLDWQPQVTLDEGLRKLLTFIKNN